MTGTLGRTAWLNVGAVTQQEVELVLEGKLATSRMRRLFFVIAVSIAQVLKDDTRKNNISKLDLDENQVC